MKKINIAFFGSAKISTFVLDYIINQLSEYLNVVLVVTNSDKPQGRDQIISQNEVKKTAIKHNLNFFDKDISKNNSDYKNNRTLLNNILIKYNIDIAIVFAYGSIIPKNILTTLNGNFFNIHPSDLPKYRGPSPTTWSLLNGDTESAITLIKMNEKMDEGDIVLKNKFSIDRKINNRSDYEESLLPHIYINLRKFVECFHKNAIQLTPQNHLLASYTTILNKNDGYIPLELLQQINTLNESELKKKYAQLFITQNYRPQYNLEKNIWNIYKCLTPWPGIWTKVTIQGQEKRLKLTRCSFTNNFTIDEVQLEGKGPVSKKTFFEGYGITLP